MFNALSSLGVLDDAHVADLFAGSGALGIEALSRGAAHCTFVESDARALAVIRANVRSLGLEDRSEVRAGRVESVARMLGDIDVALADPPYEYGGWVELMGCLASALTSGGIAVLESGREIESSTAPEEIWEIVRSKRYGRTWVSFLQRI